MRRISLSSQHIQRFLLLSTFALVGCQAAHSLPTEDHVADFAAIKSKAANVELTVNRISLDATRGQIAKIVYQAITSP